MSTPSIFTPLTKGFNWTPSTTGIGGVAIPAGETFTSSTLGIRADGDTTHAAGHYANLVIIPSSSSAETVAALNAALGAALVPGNYWVAVQQTDTLNGTAVSSAWTAEVPFSIPPQAVVPDQPTALFVS